MRLRISLLAAVTTVAVGVDRRAQRRRPNGTTVPRRPAASRQCTRCPSAGVAKNGKKFTGTYAIQRFVVKGDAVYSVGTLKGTLKNRRVNRRGVMMPATLQRSAGAVAAQVGVCPVLELVLGPIDLNLLGLRVELGGGLSANLPIVLRITAIRGGGLLGDLLCGVADLLNPTGILEQLTGNLAGARGDAQLARLAARRAAGRSGDSAPCVRGPGRASRPSACASASRTRPRATPGSP